MLKIFKNCTNLIKYLPQLCHDERNPTDCATEPHEITHAPDALRGFCVFRTNGVKPPPPIIPQFQFTRSSAPKAKMEDSVGRGTKNKIV